MNADLLISWRACVYVSACLWVGGTLFVCVRENTVILSRPLLRYCNEAAETHTLYYSKAQHYIWPNSRSLFLWELLDSFPVLWGCIVFVCVWMSVFVYV